MSASSKYDLSSSSPDRPYSSGQRSSYSTASFDRSGSFRDSVESPSFSSLSNMARSSTSANKGDVLSFLQCLRFDPKSMIGDHKLNRPGDFKRLTSVALGIAQEDLASASSIIKSSSSPLPEDFRRLKAGLKESCSKARERAKIFSESLSVINKWFPSIPSRKRSRLDALSNDRPKALLQSDRSVSGLGINKIGAHSHANTGGIESEQHKSEERIKAVPNKRTRTSMVDSRLDVRVGTPARTLITANKDKETLRPPNGIDEQADSRTMPIGVDSWEKSKMKKKRSGIKHDVPKNSVAANPSDGVMDSKQRLQQRLSVDTRPRLSDTHGFRPRMVNGGMGVGKADGITQESGVRASISRTDFDNNTLLHGRRDCPAGSDKERVKGQTINKINAREDFSSGSPTSNTKMKAITRTARSGLDLVPKLSPIIHRDAASTDWEVSHCSNKDSAAIGVINRKRSVSARSTSPPVAQWAGQRPQKISRTARRTNLLPIVPSSDATPLHDATPPHDATPNVVGSERRLLSNSPQQTKLKSDSFSYISESEESGAAEIKTKEKKTKKKKKTDEINEKDGLHVQKMSTLLLPRKNKVFDGEGQGGGIRKRGRTGRTTPSNRSLMPLKVERIGIAGTAKQLRTSILGLDKNESKGSRPATRKLSGRKPYPRQKHTTVSAAAEFFVRSNDGHEELLTAINGVLNCAAEALSSPFWRKMEPYFRHVSDMDLAFLKQQIRVRLDMLTPTPLVSEANTSHIVCNGYRSSEVGRFGSTTGGDELKPEHLSSARTFKEIPLYQRLLAALVPEEGTEKVLHNRHESVFLDTCKSRFEHEVDFELESLCPQESLSNGLSCHAASIDHQSNDNGWCFDELNHTMPNNSIIPVPAAASKYNQAENGLGPDQQLISGHHGDTFSEEQYNSMSINERLLWEIRSVGLFPDQVPHLESSEDDEIEKDISSLNEKCHELVSKKRDLLGKLLPSVSDARELQETEYESRALDKLAEMAYEKYMTCWGPNTHGMKSASGKMAKQAALAFVIQSLERYREFERTGKSCFGVPFFKDTFISGISRLSDRQPDSMIDDDSVPLDVLCSPSPEYDISKEPCLNRVKNKELSLDDVGGGTNLVSSGAPSGIRSSFSSCSKGKRSDREGKGSSREVLSRHGTTKTSGFLLTDVKGESKSKTKSKQKTTQQSLLNSSMEKKEDQTKRNMSSENASGVGNDDLGLLDDPIDLSGLQIPEIDGLGVHDDFSGQGEDIGSWLNIDEEGLQDDDFMGLEIPMDDLSDLNMMV